MGRAEPGFRVKTKTLALFLMFTASHDCVHVFASHSRSHFHCIYPFTPKLLSWVHQLLYYPLQQTSLNPLWLDYSAVFEATGYTLIPKTSQTRDFLGPILSCSSLTSALALSWPPLPPQPNPWFFRIGIPRHQPLVFTLSSSSWTINTLWVLTPTCMLWGSWIPFRLGFLPELQIHISHCLPGPELTPELNCGRWKQFLTKSKFLSCKCDVS